MRELERDSDTDDPACPPYRGSLPRTVAIVGRGRLGSAVAAALRKDSASTGAWKVSGPHARGYAEADAPAVLLCVPDREIVGAAQAIPSGRLVGHCSGAGGLDLLEAHEAFSMHPLMTVLPGGADFKGAGAAVAGRTPRALAFAASLARGLGMRPIVLAEKDRPAYHAAASIASNFLVTLEGAAERLAASAGVDRRLLAPLVRATVENWIALGARAALTGPVARGDDLTVAAQRQAVAERAAEILPLFDALTDATRTLAAA